MEKHKAGSHQLTFSQALRSGHKLICSMKEGEIIVEYFNKGGTSVARQVVTSDKVNKKVNEILDQYISFDKLAEGYRYAFVPKNLLQCWLMLIKHDKVESKEPILIMAVAKAEKMLIQK